MFFDHLFDATFEAFKRSFKVFESLSELYKPISCEATDFDWPLNGGFGLFIGDIRSRVRKVTNSELKFCSFC